MAPRLPSGTKRLYAHDTLSHSLTAPKLDAHRRELLAYSYRMLGSLADAEDAVQDALERALQGLSELQHEAALRSWLYRITTNVCLGELKQASRRALPLELVEASPPEPNLEARLPDGAWLDPCPEALRTACAPTAEAVFSARESVTLAFVAALQHLSPTQRAVVLLRDVLGFSAQEAADVLERSADSINSALLRGRAVLNEKRKRQPSIEHLGDRERQLLSSYLDAWRAGSAPDIASLLAEDVTMSMPPYALWLNGRDDVVRFLPFVFEMIGEAHFEPLEVSGGPGLACYSRSGSDGTFEPFGLQALSLAASQVTAIHAFLIPELFPAFNLKTPDAFD